MLHYPAHESDQVCQLKAEGPKIEPGEIGVSGQSLRLTVEDRWSDDWPACKRTRNDEVLLQGEIAAMICILHTLIILIIGFYFRYDLITETPRAPVAT